METVSQTVGVDLAKHVFSIWITRDTAFALTNAEMRIEWYGNDYPAKLQADTVMPLTIPAGSGWALYSMTGECASASLRVAVPMVFAQWTTNANDSLKLDDATFTYMAGDFTDGIPNSWWSLYGDIPVDQWIATNDFDGDGYLNIEEYAGQTDPQDSYSFFPETGFVEDGVRVVLQMVVNPSSTQRIYDAYWKTNLMDYTAPWQSYGLSIMGQGGPITLTVTNNDAGGRRFYRTGARLP